MEKYSEAVKDAQEKLELAEKKATDVSMHLGDGGSQRTGAGPGHGDEGRRGARDPNTRTEMSSSGKPGPAQACTNNPS